MLFLHWQSLIFGNPKNEKHKDFLMLKLLIPAKILFKILNINHKGNAVPPMISAISRAFQTI